MGISTGTEWAITLKDLSFQFSSMTLLETAVCDTWYKGAGIVQTLLGIIRVSGLVGGFQTG